MRFRKEEQVEIEALGHKFPLAEVRQSLLSAHEEFSKHAFPKNTVEDLRTLLKKFEQNQTIWIWHDHSTLASHGILAVMVGVVYDSLVFKTESEVGRSVQEYIEEGEIHIVALGSSSHPDQATLIPEHLAELEGLTVEITTSSGIQIVDILRFFKGDGLMQNLRRACLVVGTIHV